MLRRRRKPKNLFRTTTALAPRVGRLEAEAARIMREAAAEDRGHLREAAAENLRECVQQLESAPADEKKYGPSR
jgi:hypothetical protein